MPGCSLRSRPPSFPHATAEDGGADLGIGCPESGEYRLPSLIDPRDLAECGTSWSVPLTINDGAEPGAIHYVYAAAPDFTDLPALEESSGYRLLFQLGGEDRQYGVRADDGRPVLTDLPDEGTPRVLYRKAGTE